MILFHHRMLLLLLLPLAAACSKGQTPPIESASELNRYGASSGMKRSHLPALRDELARLESEHATAAQLTVAAATIPTALSTEFQAGGETVAALSTVFTPEVQKSLSKQLDKRYPVGPFVFSPTALQAAVQLKDRYDTQRQRIQRIIGNLGRGFEVQLTQGLAADTSFTEVATIANRLDAIVVAEALYRDDLSTAITTLHEMLVTVHTLAAEKHFVPRITAVHRRGEALRVMEAIARHPAANLKTHQQLARLIDDELADWPSDASAWIGDRVVGMHTYELVRDGYLLSILDEGEQVRLRREVGFDRLARQVAKNLDQDELFYLRAMRRTIAACDRPFYERQRIFREIANQLEALDDSLDYPLVADLILWKDVQAGHRWQALDRARCEAWSLALAASIDAPAPPYKVNPLTGSRYIMDLRADEVIVDGIDPQHSSAPIVIPRQVMR